MRFAVGAAVVRMPPYGGAKLLESSLGVWVDSDLAVAYVIKIDLADLGAQRRGQIAAWIVERGLPTPDVESDGTE